MKKVLVLFIACFIVSTAFGKGSAGYYTIVGLMLDKVTQQPIANKQFIIHGDTVTTNAEGKFTYEMQWVIPCPSKLSEEEYNCYECKQNPPKIALQFNGGIQKIANNWKLYYYKPRDPKKRIVCNVRLYW